MPRDNLARRLCARLPNNTEGSPREWRLIGQEQNATQLFSWISGDDTKLKTNIGAYSQESDTLEALHAFDGRVNVIQASVNESHTALVYTVKETVRTFSENGDCVSTYKPYILRLGGQDPCPGTPIGQGKTQQIMTQFLYKKSDSYALRNSTEKFILLTHSDCVKLFTIRLESEITECKSSIIELTQPDTIVKCFSWAQWDPVHQVLYFIHNRMPVQSSIESNENKHPSDATPTLSGLQFHPDMPHETVLNIPLTLPQMPNTNEPPNCSLYEDDAVPLRIHDCSLDLQIVSHPSGIVCICHHYLYQPNNDSKSEEQSNLTETNGGVHFAYSVTVLHHGYVTHCSIPDVPWTLAKSLRPTFSLYRDDYLLVHLPMLFTHLLDIGLNHEPCCHIVLPPNLGVRGDHLLTLLGSGKNIFVDLATLDIVKVNFTNAQLMSVFKAEDQIENKLSILHYFLHHDLNIDIVEELLTEVCNKPNSVSGTLCALMKEFLIGGSFVATQNCLTTAALPLVRLLPLTTNNKSSVIKVADITISVSQEQLWNTAMMLLSPRQRIIPFRSDMWTRLWDYLSPVTMRFKSHQVLDKLKVSLACYQPEALSRCSTPLSPAGGAPPSRRIGPSFSLQSAQSDAALLPFIELDTCTASKQEHVISVNLREVSMHLLKHGSATGASHSYQGSASHVHAVATRYAAAQLETSRTLCLIICKAMLATAKPDQERGFAFIDAMNPDHRHMLLKALECYSLATDSIAFPQPQGFSSFFTYLGYRTLTFANFLQYVHRNIFEVQIDFLKTIIAEAGDNSEAVLRSIRLAALGGKGRGRRALVNCSHPMALLLRAREHAATILAGQPAHMTRPVSSIRTNNTRRGLAAFPSAGRVSPLDTFLDLLTAKASLNELDFNLLIDATILAGEA